MARQIHAMGFKGFHACFPFFPLLEKIYFLIIPSLRYWITSYNYILYDFSSRYHCINNSNVFVCEYFNNG